MKKFYLFSMISLMMLFGILPRAQAQTIWDGTADISWYDATQTSFDISTPEQLAGVAQLVNSGTSFQGATLNLTADIWLNANGVNTNNWTPIGGAATPTSEEASSGNSFRGAFNGHGHAIHNLYCDKTNYFHAGLFGCIQNPCTIDSLVMYNPTVKSCGMMGCIAGMTRSGGAIYIRYCLVVNANVVGTPSGTGPSASHNNIGCIVGANYPNSSGGTHIQNCGATGTVSGFYAGGLGGNSTGDNFTNCYFAGTITNYNAESGAITAYQGSRTNCYSYCTFSGSHNGGDGTSVSQAIMQSDSMITLLGDAFKVDENNANNGYPILSFMAGVNASTTEICNGESVVLTGMGYDSYLWTPGNLTSETITVSPTTTTTYTMTGTMSDGSTGTHSITITVYPQAVINATVAASSDGQVHGTVSPESTTVPCLSSDNVTFTITPDEGWRVASVYMNGTLVNGEEGWGSVTVTVNPGGSLANVVINMTNAPTCIQPANLQVNDLHATSAEVVWHPAATGLPATFYNVTIVNQFTHDTTYDVAYDTTYSLPTLDPGTSYTVMVTASCSDNTESAAATRTFTTPALPIALPYTQDFEGDVATILTDFEFVHNGTNQWRVGSATGVDDGQGGTIHSLYVSNDNGVNNAYTISSTSNTYAVLNIEFPNTPAEYHLEFDWKGQGEGNYDYLYAYLCDASVNMPSTGAPSGTDVCGKLNLQSNWQHKDAILNNVVGTSKKLVFWWRNDGSVGTQPPAAIDNISIVGYTCGRPTDLVLTGSTSESLSVSWTENGSSTSWSLFYRVNGSSEDYTEVSVTGTPEADLYGLSTDTKYDMYVVSHCDDGEDSQASVTVSFRTQCGPLTELPYFNNFDDVISVDGTNFITCWNRLTTDPAHVVRCYGSATHSGSYSLDFHYTPSCSTIAVTPQIDASIPLNTLMLDFWAYSGLGQGWFEIGTMSDPNDITTYEFYDTLRLSAPNTWENIIFTLENYTGSNQYIAILETQGTTTSLILDDFTIDYIPVCYYPMNIAVTGLGNTTATLAWDEQGDATSWNIEYGPAGFTPGQGNGTVVTAYENPYTVTDLTPTVTYDFYVQSICSDDVSSFNGPASATPGQYIFGVTGHDTITTCGMILYDNGGPNGDYSNSCDFTLVIYPEIPNAVVALNGTLNTESISYDYITFYDGVGTGSQITKIGGANQTVNVMSTTGPITLVFHSDGSVVRPGFAITASCVTCYPASGLQVSNIMTTSADISWNSGSGDEYLVYLYGPSDTTVFNVFDTTLALTTLNLNTTYAVAVQTICSDGDTASLTAPVSFTTPTVPATIPYLTDFEDATDNIQWGLVNGTQTNKWYIGAPTDGTSDVNTTPGGMNGLYISNNNGASNTYTGTESHVYAFRDVLVPDGTTELKLSFDWKAQGNNATYEFLRVYWLDPAVVTANAGSNPPSVGGVNYDLQGMPGYPTNGAHWLSQQNTWQHEEMLISATQFAGMGNGDHIYRLYFHWRNTSGSTNPPAAVDNVSLTVVTCATPMDLAASNITENSADLTWTGSADLFGVTILGSDGTQDYQTTTTNSLSLTGLNPNTAYQVAVRGYCGSDSSMLSQGIQFTTACGAITTLPFFADFNTYSSMNGSNFVECWSRHASDPSNHWVYVTTNDAYAGGSLDFHYTPNCYTMAVTPMFDPSISLNTLMVDGMTRIHLNGTAGTFEIGTMSDPNDPTTFTPYETITYSATFTWLPFTVLLNNYTGNDHYIAFRAMNGLDVSYLLDNLTFDVIPSCFHPTSASVSDITGDGATISWNGTTSNYVLEYGPAGFTQGTGTTVNVNNAMSYTLTGLNAITAYTVYIYSDCGPDGLSTGISVNFTTTMVAVNLPYTTDFTTDQAWELNNGTCANHWMMGTPSGESQSALFITNDNSSAGYNNSSSSTVMAEKLFYMPSDDSVHVEFDIRAGGESSFDYFKVFLVPSTETFTAGTGHNSQSGNTYSTNALNFSAYKSQTGYGSNPFTLNLTQGNTIHVSVNMPNPDANGLGKLVFLWRNDSSQGTQPGAIVTNVTVSTDGSGPVVTNPTVATNAAESITQTAATLHATITNPDNVTVTAKGFEWKATAGGTYTQIAGTGTGNNFTANLTGLTANTDYTFRAFITFNGQTVYGNELTFTTLPEDTPEPCETPTNITVGDVTDQSIVVSWDADPNVSSWNIQYRPENGQLISATSNTNNYTLTDLSPETEYQIQVQADCGDGNLSEWSTLVTATTTVGIDSWLENSVTLYPNPAQEVVNVQCTMYNIQMAGELQLFDVYGKLLQIVPVTSEITQINVSSLANGMYFVRVTTEAGMVTKTFVKK